MHQRRHKILLKVTVAIFILGFTLGGFGFNLGKEELERKALSFRLSEFGPNYAVAGTESETTAEVGNVAPTASNVVLNGAADIDLSSGSTKDVSVAADVSDNNTCTDITGVSANIYVSGESCDTSNDNTCYFNISCDVSDCTDGGDTSATASCSTGLWFHANPDNWLATVTVTDSNNATGTDDSPTRAVNSLLAINVPGSIGYGTLNPSDDSTVSSDVTNHGNVAIHSSIKGTDMTSGSDSIAVAQQKYDLTSGTYAELSTTLGSGDKSLLVDLSKPTDNSPSNSADIVYWGLEVPAGTPDHADYSGTNTYTAVSQ